MGYPMIHVNFNVADLDKSIAFYREALGLEPVRRREGPGGSFIITYLGSGENDFQLELTWLRDHPQKYDLGEGEFHLAFRADDIDELYEKHKAMGCVCQERKGDSYYFIEDPDGYWLEVLPPVR